ncbi:MAG TPA: ATP-binding protein [Candidatus Acidoferrales bacterium]|nr:ATP-binding protein [Candidatus Acidoferrales bacterium]
MTDKDARTEKTLVLPYDPIEAAMRSPEHARRAIQGILESYNSNHDALAEAVQNSMDALEDACIEKLPGPYLLEITIDLKANAISVFDTGIGMSQAQVCEAFAPTATFKDIPAKIKKRGNKYPYRGYKGVGLTFLAYGTNDVQIQSRQNGSAVKGRMRFGRDWVQGKRPDPPMLDVDNSPTPLDRRKRGTYPRLLFSPETRPASLVNLGSSLDIWEAIIRTRTAVGQIIIGQEPAGQFKVQLNLVNKDGSVSKKQISPQFYYPHLTEKNPPFRFLDVGKYHNDHPGIADIPRDYQRQDAVYIEWTTTDITEQLDQDEKQEFEAELAEFSPRLYAFRPYDEPTWTAITESATGQKRTHFVGPGLVIGVNHQRIASESIRIQPSRSEYLASNVFVLVHFDKAALDQGRKALQPQIMDLAQRTADDAIQYLLKQGGFLKPAGEKTTGAQRAVEKGHEDWVYNVKTHAKDNPLSVPPVCYVSAPITEQDVIGIFNQLAALGLFPGLRILATSASKTYDCYVQFDCQEDLDRLRYGGIDKNPLGLSLDTLGAVETGFSTRGLTLEFKNNLEGLLGNLNNSSSRKAFRHIDICVCWGALQERHRWYTLDAVTEANLHVRHYPGVTHVLRRDDEAHVIQVIVLEDVIKKILAGQIRLAAPARR